MPLMLGVEIGGTKLQLGLGRGDGRILGLRRLEIRPEGGAESILESLSQAIEPLVMACGQGWPVAAGIGFGGPVDPAAGVILRSNHVAGWSGFPIVRYVSRTLRIPLVVLQNDSDVAALAEARLGAGRGHSPVLYVNSGSGVGGGLVIDGVIYRGSGSGAVEIGHVVLSDPEEGAWQTVEERASGWAIGRAGRELVSSGQAAPDGPLMRGCGGDPERVTGELVGRAAIEGDPAALLIVERAARALGAGIAMAANLLAPSRVILGGGVSQLPPLLWLEPIRRVARQRTYEPIRLEIVTAELGQDVVVQGALLVAAEAWTKLASG
ncbi:MAG: glucokinase [Isosphaeraceae bacterium]|nr:MAG: glucokinase [Isosphaeraceae bacterium]